MPAGSPAVPSAPPAQSTPSGLTHSATPGAGARLEVTGDGALYCADAFYGGCAAALLLQPDEGRPIATPLDWPPAIQFETDRHAMADSNVLGPVGGAPATLGVGRWKIGLAQVISSDAGTCDNPCTSPYFPTSTSVLCGDSFEVTPLTQRVVVRAHFGVDCAIDISLMPSSEVSPDPSSSAASAAFSVDAGLALTPESNAIQLLVNEKACIDDRASAGRPQSPGITYSADAVVITVTSVQPDLAACSYVSDVVVPTLVNLAEPLGARTVVDGGTPGDPVRWQPIPTGSFALPTYRTAPYKVDVPLELGICAGVGLDTQLDAAADDPRLVWLGGSPGSSRPLLWPAGFRVSFSQDAEIHDETGKVVHRQGEHVDGACVVPPNDSLSLYGDGYSVLR